MSKQDVNGLVILRVRLYDALSTDAKAWWSNQSGTVRDTYAMRLHMGEQFETVLRVAEEEATCDRGQNWGESALRRMNAEAGIYHELSENWQGRWLLMNAQVKRAYVESVLKGMALLAVTECFMLDWRAMQNATEDIEAERFDRQPAEAAE